jgi:hypothetical protein
MAKLGIKKITWYAIVGLLVAVALVPLFKAVYPEFFPSISGFRDVDCLGKTCEEGQFCQNNACISKTSARYTTVPEGNE